MKEKFNIGDIVLSLAGHDKGKYFVIVSVEGIFACIANGKLHKAEKPKKKKIKHLKNIGCTYEQLTGVQLSRERVTNPSLKKAISKFKNSLN